MGDFVSTFTKTFESKTAVLNFFLFWVANAIVYMTVVGGIIDMMPPRLNWISNVAFPICILAGLVTSVIAVYKAHGVLLSLQEVAKSWFVTLVGLLVLIALYTLSFAFSPTIYVTMDQFETAGLTPTQLAQIQQFVTEKGYVSLSDLDHLNLTSEQKTVVTQLIVDLGFTTREDAAHIAQTEIAIVATQTAVARLSTCYITPELGLSTVAVRKAPSVNEAFLGAFSQGQRLHVIGHSGGRMNQDRWWLVEFAGNESDNRYGWVSSAVVTEIDEEACIKVEKAPGF
jgi:hypothetical protein